MHERAVIVVVCALALALESPTAFAQGGERRAVELFQQSEIDYHAGRFREAAELLRQAYAAQANPDLLYNLGRALEGLGDLEGAVDAYRRYLASAQRIPDRAAIEAKVNILDRQVALQKEPDVGAARASAAEPKPPEPARVAQAPKPRTARASLGRRVLEGPLPWAALALGVGGVVAGGALRAAAFSKHDDATTAPSQVQAEDDQQSAVTLATASTVAFVAGGVLAVGGIAGVAVGFFARSSPSGATSRRDRWLVVEGRF